MSTCDARRPTLAPLLIETLATLYSETREHLLGGDEANYLEHVLSRENLPIAYGAETAHRGKQRAGDDERPEWLHDTLLPRFNSSATGVAMSRTVVKRRRVPRSLGQGYPQPDGVVLVNLYLPSQQEVPGLLEVL